MNCLELVGEGANGESRGDAATRRTTTTGLTAEAWRAQRGTLRTTTRKQKQKNFLLSTSHHNSSNHAVTEVLCDSLLGLCQILCVLRVSPVKTVLVCFFPKAPSKRKQGVTAWFRVGVWVAGVSGKGVVSEGVLRDRTFRKANAKRTLEVYE